MTQTKYDNVCLGVEDPTLTGLCSLGRKCTRNTLYIKVYYAPSINRPASSRSRRASSASWTSLYLNTSFFIFHSIFLSNMRTYSFLQGWVEAGFKKY